MINLAYLRQLTYMIMPLALLTACGSLSHEGMVASASIARLGTKGPSIEVAVSGSNLDYTGMLKLALEESLDSAGLRSKPNGNNQEFRLHGSIIKMVDGGVARCQTDIEVAWTLVRARDDAVQMQKIIGSTYETGPLWPFAGLARRAAAQEGAARRNIEALIKAWPELQR